MSVEGVKTLAGRVRWLVDTFWSGRVRRAAQDLGVTESLLHRVVTGELDSPRTGIVDAFRRLFDVSADWLLGGEGPLPERTDRYGRPLVYGVPRWRRAVAGLELEPTIEAEVLELPYGVWRAARVIDPTLAEELPDWARESLEESLASWSTLMEGLSKAERRALPNRLRSDRGLLRLAFAGAATAAPRSRVNEAVRALLDSH